MRVLVGFGMWAIILLGFVHPALAADRDSDRLFTVHGVAVDVTAVNATEARSQALADAQARAWVKLTNKLVSEDSIGRLPPASPPLLERLVRAVDVREERSSARRYLARIDVSFWADGVRDLFAQAGVSYTESGAGPYLLLPVLVEGGAYHLFGEHEWRTALEAADFKNRLVSYRLPTETVQTRRWLNPLLQADVRPSDLEPVARIFSVAKIVVAKAVRRFDFASGKEALDYEVVIGPLLDDNDVIERSIRSGRLVAGPDESSYDLLLKAADMVLREADNNWKARTLVEGSDLNNMSVLVPVRGLSDWMAVRDRLAEVSTVRHIEMTEINIPLSKLIIEYIGTKDQLQLALAQANLVLDQGADTMVLRPVEQPVEGQIPGMQWGGDGDKSK